MILAGTLLSSCGKPEPAASIEIEFFGENGDRSRFASWVLDMIEETCQVRGSFENGVLSVPESKIEPARRSLEIWTGENTSGVSFHNRSSRSGSSASSSFDGSSVST